MTNDTTGAAVPTKLRSFGVSAAQMPCRFTSGNDSPGEPSWDVRRMSRKRMHLQSGRDYGKPAIPDQGERPRNGVGSVMDIERLERHRATDRLARRACLVAGCPCKDTRIVSHRRAAFFAAWATRHGETADRMVAPDPTWRFTTSTKTGA
jgi:hypothetical protein